ncbi:regulatory protein RecX [Citricoccus parietis]|uniref:Regulatory protein RecX n=1 Tax=Citricoccus parietis TaxID=592307 RepID=A0ABV5G826_9MICC
MTRRHLRAVPDVPEHLADDPEPAAAEVARTIVLRQLTASPKSRKQLEEKLAERDVPEDVAAAVLDRLEDVRLVDDTAYAENFVRTRQRSKGLARGALRRELQQKGVSGEAAEQALETISEDAEREAAVELVQRKIRGRQLPSGDAVEDRPSGTRRSGAWPACSPARDTRPAWHWASSRTSSVDSRTRRMLLPWTRTRILR